MIMSNAILPHTSAVFAIGSTLVLRILLRLSTHYIYDTTKYYVQEESNETKSGQQL